MCLTIAAFMGSYLIKKNFLPEPFRGLSDEPDYHVILLGIIIIWYASFKVFDLYTSYRRQSLQQILWNMIKAVSTAMIILILFLYIIKEKNVSRIFVGIFFLLNIGLLAVSKGFVCRVLKYYRNRGFNFRNILIIGSRERAKDVIRSVTDRSGTGFKIIGCLELDEEDVGKEVAKGVSVIGTIHHLKKILLDEVVDELIFAVPLKKVENADEYLSLAEDIGIPIRIIPDWQLHQFMYKPGSASLQFEEFLDIPTLAFRRAVSPWKEEMFVKSVFDYAFAGIGLILLSPLFLIIAISIKLFSKGPIFFKQERCGLNGRKFMFYKFRTMMADAEERRNELEHLNEMDGPVFKIKNDPRIIPFIGTLLRKTSLDELPQLINVLKGEMSLIGPRPPIPAEVKMYDVWQRRRLSMKPGLTCLWQITPHRNEVSFKEWMKQDLRYIDNWSLKLDLKIMLKTILVVVLGAGR